MTLSETDIELAAREPRGAFEIADQCRQLQTMGMVI